MEVAKFRNMLEVVQMMTTREQTSDDRLYFAYGSNLHMAQMAQRCPYAVPVTRARLYGWKLEFRGVLTIVPAKPEDYVDGAIWRTTPYDEKKLDVYEGFPRMYRKEDIHVEAVDPAGEKTGDQFECYVYLMNYGHPNMPYPSYLGVCIEGAHHWGIPRGVFDRALADLHEEPVVIPQAPKKRQRKTKATGTEGAES